jgi:hypothetical protein
MKKLVLAFSTLALAVASAGSSYHVKLFEKSVVGGTELKPGEYKIEVKENRAIVKDGQNVAEAPVKVESGDQKYASTSVRYANGDGKYRITEIRLGGTNTKLVFNE